MIESTLKKIGLSDKEITVYLTCLKLGPSPVRKIATTAEINRGTAYDILRALINLGLVSYYHKDKHQYFIAEDPSRLVSTIDQRQQDLEITKAEVTQLIPQLKSLYDNAGTKPVAKYYEGAIGIKTVLCDVLETCKNGDRQYYAYSSSTIRKYLYEAYRSFSQDRIKAQVAVKTISIGPGGETVGLDERKWLSQDASTPTYTLIYNGKLAMVSVDGDGKPIGVIIEDKNIYQTQKMIFEFIWQELKV